MLVEGAADKPILEGAFRCLREPDSSRVLVNGSVAENVGLLPRFYQRGHLPFVVYLDADSGARALKASLLGWGVPEEQIVDLHPLFNNFEERDFELEDVTTIGFYHSAVVAAYPDQLVEPQPADNRQKRTKYYEVVFRDRHAIGFNKRRVAEAVKRLLVEGKGDAGTLDNLRTVTDAIWNALQRQVAAEPVGH